MENDPHWHPPPSMEFSIIDFFLNPSLRELSFLYDNFEIYLYARAAKGISALI